MTTTPGRIVEFPSDNATLRGRLYEHAGRQRRPTLVMTHGFSATITGMTADRYAEVVHAVGLNVLLFDHRGFGISGGEPRQLLSRWLQIAGYRHALDYVTTLPTTDADRLGVWGDSASGAVALGLAAFDERVRSVVVQVPACGSSLPAPDPDGSRFLSLLGVYDHGVPTNAPIRSTGPMPVVSDDQVGTPSFLEPITAFRWFTEYGGRPDTGWLNWATNEGPQLAVPFQAGLVAPHLRGPSLWVIARDDEMPGA